jgi:hypothetical protein
VLYKGKNMFKELDAVRLKKDDPEVDVTTKEVGTIVYYISEWKGEKYYTIEFLDGIYTKDKALDKYYREEDLIKAE